MSCCCQRQKWGLPSMARGLGGWASYHLCFDSPLFLQVILVSHPQPFCCHCFCGSWPNFQLLVPASLCLKGLCGPWSILCPCSWDTGRSEKLTPLKSRHQPMMIESWGTISSPFGWLNNAYSSLVLESARMAKPQFLTVGICVVNVPFVVVSLPSTLTSLHRIHVTLDHLWINPLHLNP